jgi:PhzF family phenazine biosynthesis protein
MQRAFSQVDVFTSVPYRGNPVAVVLDGDGLSTEQMQRFANWTNLSETTFVQTPTQGPAHYQVRIFTATQELPFAGHPTLGTCHAWVESTGAQKEQIVQQCQAGLIDIRRNNGALAFKAPPLVRSGAVDEALTVQVADMLGIRRHDIVEAQWVDNGPGWVAALLRDAEAVLALKPKQITQPVGVVGAYRSPGECAFEVRAFAPMLSTEDPVTGSLNASLAQWLISTGRATPPYLVSQGTALGRAGRVHISADPDGTVWVGGGTVTCIRGHVEL